MSRANGDDGGLRTYSRIPLHLRGKTPGAADAVNDLNTGNSSNIANRDKISTDATGRKTRVGRTIQTPARFVQMATLIRIGKLQLHYRAKYLLPNNGCIN